MSGSEEPEEMAPQAKLKEGLILKELLKNHQTEFVIDGSGECEEDHRVESTFDFEDFEQHINMECISSEPHASTIGSTPFDSLRARMTDVTPDGKVKKMILIGGSTKLAKNSIVYVHYNSYCEMEGVPFDSSYLRSQKPLRIQLGVTSLYPGFAYSLNSMRDGEKSQFLIEPEYAFGKMGAPPRIPPNATILLVIEIIKTVDCGDIIENPTLSVEERNEFSNIYKKAKGYHALGNDFFNSAQNIRLAIENYRKAENALVSCRLNNQEEEDQMKNLLFKVYLNLAVCYNHPKINKPERVCIVCREALFSANELATKSSKLFYNLGKANASLCNYREAKRNFKRAYMLNPCNEDISNQFVLLEEKIKKYQNSEKSMFQKALGFKIEEKVEPEVVTEGIDPVIFSALENFKNSERSQLNLPAGLTWFEIRDIKKASEDLGLRYQEDEIRGKKSIFITKF